MPRASLIIATHSRPRLLPRAVRSALESGSDVEVVISDDASTDETAEVIRQLETTYPQVKSVRAETNGGVATARNLGIQAATGEILGFLDDDDLRLPGSLDKQLALLDSHPEAGWCYAQAFTGNEECQPAGDPQPAKLPSGDIFFDLLADNTVHCLTVLFRRDTMAKLDTSTNAEGLREFLDPTLNGCDDWDLWLRLAAVSSVVVLPEPVAVWRAASPDSGQGTSRYAELLTRSANAHRDKWQKLPPALRDPAATRKATDACFRNFSEMLIWHGYQGLQGGHKEYARTNFLAALKLSPRRALSPGIWRLVLRTFL